MPLIRAAAADADVVEGLVGEYAGLSAENREQIILAIVEDAAEESVSSCAALAALLSVEEDVRLARVLEAELATRSPHELRATHPARGWIAGEDSRGAVMLERPLFCDFLEVVTVAWDMPDKGIVSCRFDPLLSRADAGRQWLYPDFALREQPFEDAVDRLCSALWKVSRAGHALPTELRHVLDLFC